jgi:hypothetical protein
MNCKSITSTLLMMVVILKNSLALGEAGHTTKVESLADEKNGKHCLRFLIFW